MDFLKLFVRIVAMLPEVIQGTETLFGAETALASGEQKKRAALEVVAASINLADAVSSHKIADAERFSAGLGQIVDGVVACLNASIWFKAP
jgi:hypothetical protein